jgi:hypothetical protein
VRHGSRIQPSPRNALNASLSYQMSLSDRSRTFGNARPGSERAAWHGSAVPSGATPRNTEPHPFMHAFGRCSK